MGRPAISSIRNSTLSDTADLSTAAAGALKRSDAGKFESSDRSLVSGYSSNALEGWIPRDLDTMTDSWIGCTIFSVTAILLLLTLTIGLMSAWQSYFGRPVYLARVCTRLRKGFLEEQRSEYDIISDTPDWHTIRPDSAKRSGVVGPACSPAGEDCV